MLTKSLKRTAIAVLIGGLFWRPLGAYGTLLQFVVSAAAVVEDAFLSCEVNAAPSSQTGGDETRGRHGSLTPRPTRNGPGLLEDKMQVLMRCHDV